MQVADNQAVLDSDMAESRNGTEPSTEHDDGGETEIRSGETEPQGGEAASTDHLAGKRVGKPFEPGNQLWRRRGKAPGLQASRRSLREALHEALTPDKMRDCVAKMLDIIASSDKKAAVQAFKVLADAAGVRGDGDAIRHGPSFTFILPGAGAIPTSGAALPVLDAESVEPIEPDES